MATRIGKIELVGLTNIYTEDARSIVQKRGPGQSGSVVQDLGREPVKVVLEGLLLGDDTQAALEELRDAQSKAKPLSFAADAVAGTELTEVVIADLKIRQLAGFKDRYSFFMRVREYTEPPTQAGAGASAVQNSAANDAQARAKAGAAAASVVQNPGTLVEAVGKNPALLEHMSDQELLVAVTKSNANGQMSGSGFSTVLTALAKINPQSVIKLIENLSNANSLGDFVQKLAEGGVDLLKQSTGIDLGNALTIVKGLSQGSDFLMRAQRVAKSAEALSQAIDQFDPFASAQQTTPSEVP